MTGSRAAVTSAICCSADWSVRHAILLTGITDSVNCPNNVTPWAFTGWQTGAQQPQNNKNRTKPKWCRIIICASRLLQVGADRNQIDEKKNSFVCAHPSFANLFSWCFCRHRSVVVNRWTKGLHAVFVSLCPCHRQRCSVAVRVSKSRKGEWIYYTGSGFRSREKLYLFVQARKFTIICRILCSDRLKFKLDFVV